MCVCGKQVLSLSRWCKNGRCVEVQSLLTTECVSVCVFVAVRYYHMELKLLVRTVWPCAELIPLKLYIWIRLNQSAASTAEGQSVWRCSSSNATWQRFQELWLYWNELGKCLNFSTVQLSTTHLTSSNVSFFLFFAQSCSTSLLFCLTMILWFLEIKKKKKKDTDIGLQRGYYQIKSLLCSTAAPCRLSTNKDLCQH